MGVMVSQDDVHNVRATVCGDFDFEASRQLLLGVKRRWDGSGQTVDVTLSGVTRATSCSIGALVLLSELAGKNFRIRMDHCRNDVQSLFGCGLLDRFFPPEVLAGCRECHVRQQATCPAN